MYTRKHEGRVSPWVQLVRPKIIRTYCDCRFDYVTGKRVICKRHALKAKKKLPMRELDPIPPSSLLEIGRGIGDPIARGLFFLTYLTGARISEAVDFRTSHLTEQNSFWKIKVKVLKKRNGLFNQRNVLIPKPPLSRCGEAEMMAELLSVLRSCPPTIRPFRVWGQAEGKGHYMSKYLARKVSISIPGKIRNLATGAWTETTISKPLGPHYLRKCRATHLVEYYGFNSAQLMVFFEWSDPKMPMAYVGAFDLAQAFAFK